MEEQKKETAAAAPNIVAKAVKSVREMKSLQLFIAGLAGFIGLVILFFVGYGVIRVYFQGATDRVTGVVATILRLPLAKVNGEVIRYTDYLEDLKAINTLKKFETASGGTTASLTDAQMSDQVVWRLANNIFINKLASQYDVKAEQADVDDLKTKMLANFKSTAEAETELMKRYGWTLARYEEKVIQPYILQSKLSEKLSTDQKLREAILAKAEGVLKEINGGMKFEDAAVKYGEDGTAAKGGDLGCFGKGEMVPQFETAVFAMKKGEMSAEVLETPFGFHIVRVDDIKTEKVADENGKMVNKDVVCARHIVFLFPSIEKELDTMVKQALVSWYVGKVNNPLKQLETK